MRFSIAIIALVASGAVALPQGSDSWGNWQQSSAAPAGSPAAVDTPAPANQGKAPGDNKAPAPSPTPSQASPLPAGQDQWSNWQNSSPAPVPAAVATPTPAKDQPAPAPTTQNIPAGGNGKASPTPAASPAGDAQNTPAGDNGKASPIAAAKPAGQQGSGSTEWSRWVKARDNNQPGAPQQTQGAQQQKQGAQQQTQGSPTSGQVQASNASPSPNPVFSAPAAEIVANLGADPSSICTWEFILTCAEQAVSAGTTCLTPLAEASTNCFSQSSCASAIGNNAATCAQCFNLVGKQQFIKAAYTEKSNSDVAPIFEAFVSYGVCDAQGTEIHS